MKEHCSVKICDSFSLLLILNFLYGLQETGELDERH